MGMDNDRLLSQTISLLRFPLTMGIFFIHFYLAKTGITIHGVTYGLNQPEWFLYVNVYFSGILTAVCVPFFFWMSGLLFFYKTDFSWSAYLGKLRRRFRSLFIPYVLWNIIAVLWTAKIFLPFLSSIFSNAGGVKLNLTLSGVLYTFFDNSRGLFILPDAAPPATMLPADGPLWYVRDLMILILFSPVIYWFIKRLGLWCILLLYIVFLFFLPDGYFGLLLSSLLFFSWGAYYGIHHIDVIARFRRYRLAPVIYLVITLLDLVTYRMPINPIMPRLGEPFGIIAIVSIASWFLETGKVKVNKTLSNSSFFVFALHIFIINDIAKVLFIALGKPDNTYVLLGFYFLVPFIVAAICVGIYMAVKRVTPSLCSLLTGGR